MDEIQELSLTSEAQTFSFRPLQLHFAQNITWEDVNAVTDGRALTSPAQLDLVYRYLVRELILH